MCCFRTYKRRCTGRLRKYLGDLSLLAGLPGEAVLHYQTALDILKSSNDWLWLGGRYQFISLFPKISFINTSKLYFVGYGWDDLWKNHLYITVNWLILLHMKYRPFEARKRLCLINETFPPLYSCAGRTLLSICNNDVSCG